MDIHEHQPNDEHAQDTATQAEDTRQRMASYVPGLFDCLDFVVTEETIDDARRRNIMASSETEDTPKTP